MINDTPSMKLNRLELLEPAENFEYDTIEIIRKVTCSSSCYKDLNTRHDNTIFGICVEY